MQYYTFKEASTHVNLKPATLRFLSKQGLKSVIIGEGLMKPRRVTTLKWIEEFMALKAIEKES
jgi:hypothetical protein